MTHQHLSSWLSLFVCILIITYWILRNSHLRYLSKYTLGYISSFKKIPEDWSKLFDPELKKSPIQTIPLNLKVILTEEAIRRNSSFRIQLHKLTNLFKDEAGACPTDIKHLLMEEGENIEEFAEPDSLVLRKEHMWLNCIIPPEFNNGSFLESLKNSTNVKATTPPPYSTAAYMLSIRYVICIIGSILAVYGLVTEVGIANTTCDIFSTVLLTMLLLHTIYIHRKLNKLIKHTEPKSDSVMLDIVQSLALV